MAILYSVEFTFRLPHSERSFQIRLIVSVQSWRQHQYQLTSARAAVWRKFITSVFIQLLAINYLKSGQTSGTYTIWTGRFPPRLWKFLGQFRVPPAVWESAFGCLGDFMAASAFHFRDHNRLLV